MGKCKSKQPWDFTLHQSEWLRIKTQETAGVGEDVKKEEHSSTAGGVAMVQPLWKSVWQFLRKLGTSLPEDPAIPVLGIYPEDSPACNKDTCSTMFIAALFIIARSWKEPRYPSMEEWMQKNMVYTHNGVLFSH